ncbi:MAG TPA: nickel pincer cofactor biosynthesis protein LarC [Vicinamibacterales bacterium]|nr:nickel pincer cofactor biosynthesis protein LarC [Vicinamibacterales bacterium]
MKILYFDCFAGAAGDMILGALLDAGLPFDELKRALGSLAVEGWDISVDRVVKTGVTATKFRVHEHAHAHTGDARHHGHHHLKQIFAAIERSALSDSGKARAIKMFRRLGEAEAAIHGTTLEKVHLHEVGALDSIIDIVGAVFALEWFAAGKIVVSPMNVGGGMVKSAHGVFPVPAPATVALLKDAPVYSSGIQAELLTPTGALILTEYASEFGPVPPMKINRVGYGAGDRELKETPNVVRLLVGETVQSLKAPDPQSLKAPDPQGLKASDPQGLKASDPQRHRVVVVECEIDDMNPQIFGALMDKLYAAGALEVFYAAVQMKKNRPGTLMTIVAKPEQRETMTEIVFRESTTIGVRYQELSRECLDRELVTVATPLGPVRFKVARRGGRVFNAQPEFDDLAKLSQERGIPIKDVQALAHKAWLEQK